jgi:4-hydroxybutyrate CoA-transferase
MSAARWPEELRERIADAPVAVGRIQSGELIAVGASNAEPSQLVSALRARASELDDVNVLLWPGGFPTPLADPELAPHLTLRLWVPNAHTRRALASGQAVYVPGHQHGSLRRLAAGDPPLAGALVMLAPPDAEGYCSFGTSAVNMKPACEAASYVLAEINEQMPRTRGDARIHCSRIDAAIPVSRPIPELARPALGERQRAIAAHVAQIVPDGATIECGIGAVPDAVLGALVGHRELAIRSGIIGDGVLALAEQGALRARNERGAPIATGSILGTKRLYDFVADNPLVEAHDGLWTHDPALIGRCDRFMAINSAIEIDLSGQVNCEQADGQLVAGVGGQSDFIRGARMSREGRSIIVMTSTAKRGERSRIVRRLESGVPVSLPRADVEWVVTEHGAVNLDGLSLDERAAALISIADPSHVPDLEAEPQRLR